MTRPLLDVCSEKLNKQAGGNFGQGRDRLYEEGCCGLITGTVTHIEKEEL